MSSAPAKHQFGLGHLFVATTLVALSLSTLQFDPVTQSILIAILVSAIGPLAWLLGRRFKFALVEFLGGVLMFVGPLIAMIAAALNLVRFS